MRSRADGITDFYVYDSTTTPGRRMACPQRTARRECGSSPTRACPGRRWRAASPGSTPTTCYVYDGTFVPADLRLGAEARPALRPVGRPRLRRPARHRRHPRAGRGRTERPTTACGGRDPRRRRRRDDHELQRMARGNADRAGEAQSEAPYASYDGAYGLDGTGGANARTSIARRPGCDRYSASADAAR